MWAIGMRYFHAKTNHNTPLTRTATARHRPDHVSLRQQFGDVRDSPVFSRSARVGSTASAAYIRELVGGTVARAVSRWVAYLQTVVSTTNSRAWFIVTFAF